MFWPTPTAWTQEQTPGAWQKRADKLRRKHANGNGAGMPLSVAVQMFPTPMAHDANGKAPADMSRHTPSLAATIGGKLNPRWVAWLMGYPLGHTDLGPSETQSFLKSRRGSRKG
jgi:hypothetical protein